jgi:hypothetical protein
MPVAASSAASAASVVAHLAPAANAGPPWWSQGIWTSELAKGLPAAIVALGIGLAAAAIAWRQARIAGAKLKLDLFEKRIKLYIELRDFLAYSSGEGIESTDLTHLGQIHSATTSAHFLFGDEIGRRFEEARMQAISLRQAMRALQRTDPADPGRSAAEAKVTELLGWFESELKGLRARFAKYMDFEQWH